MIDYDGRFWNAYYLDRIKSPSARIMDEMSRSLMSIQLVLSDSFTPAVRRAAWAIEDFTFVMELAGLTRWHRLQAHARHLVRRLTRRWAT